MLASYCANHVTSVMWLWVGVALPGMSSGCGGVCPSPLMSCMYCTFDVIYISKASLWYCLSGIPYGNNIYPVPTSIA